MSGRISRRVETGNVLFLPTALWVAERVESQEGLKRNLPAMISCSDLTNDVESQEGLKPDVKKALEGVLSVGDVESQEGLKRASCQSVTGTRTPPS